MVYKIDGDITVGVPESSPVVESKTIPAGSAGKTVQDTTVPPPAVGITEVILVPFSNMNGLPL